MDHREMFDDAVEQYMRFIHGDRSPDDPTFSQWMGKRPRGRVIMAKLDVLDLVANGFADNYTLDKPTQKGQ